MDQSDILIIGAVVVLLAFSACFSAAETAFSQLNANRLRDLTESGRKGAACAKKLWENTDWLESTLLIGNTLSNIAAATLYVFLFFKYLHGAGTAISVIAMTILILIVGEISPKALAKENPEGIACATAPFLRVVRVILAPLHFVFAGWKRLLIGILGPKEEKGNAEEELITIVDEAEREGGLDSHESDLIRSAIEFNDLDVSDILTPRVDMIAVEKDMSMEEIDRLFTENGFSRLPVYEGSLDHIIGVLHEKDFHALMGKGEAGIQGALKKVVNTVPTAKISHLLRELQRRKTHIAVVVDEFGGTMGIVTMEDILEELVGDIWDEHDQVVQEFVPLEAGAYGVMGSADLDDFFDLFEVDPPQEEYDSSTVGGWVVEVLEEIPSEGACFVREGIHVTVTRTDQRKVLEIEARAAEETAPEKGEEEKQQNR